MKWLWAILLIVPSVLGVTIHGTVYDYGLEKLPNAVVEINTTPQQLMVATNGSYSFEVPPGNYVLKAESDDLKTEANVSATIEGLYVMDLILLPSFDVEEEFLLSKPDVPFVEEVIQDAPRQQWLLWVLVFLILGFILYKIFKKPVKIVEKKMLPVSDDLKKIVEFLEKEGGRTTQKEIRKQFPYSEAKVSLMIDELEQKGLLKRIKKGRGNVIVKE